MALSDDSTLKVREAGNTVSKLCLKDIQKQAIEDHTQGTSQKAAVTTAALHHMPNVFLPNLTMARIESENVARLHSRAAVPAPNTHKYTLHKYLGQGHWSSHLREQRKCLLQASKPLPLEVLQTEGCQGRDELYQQQKWPSGVLQW